MTLLEEVVAAQGGVERWERVARLTIDLRIGGRLLATRFQSPRARALRMIIDPRRPYAILAPFPRPGQRGVFDSEFLRVETDAGAIVAERNQDRRQTRLMWDSLDLLSFLGYALWNYAVTPFVFTWPGFVCEEGRLWRENGERWRTLHVTFPPGIPTHCREQTFYFDEALRLRRLDYTAEAFGRWTRGAHYVHDHREFDGLLFPTHRVVYPRLLSGKPLRFAVMEGRIDSVKVENR